ILRNLPSLGMLPDSHPYRFVFIDACQCGMKPYWARAFGIPDTMSSGDVIRHPILARAFLGWTGTVFSVGNDTQAIQYQQTLSYFYTLWLRGFTLEQCVKACSKFGSPGAPYDPAGIMNIQLPLGLPQDYLSWQAHPTPGQKPDLPGGFTRIYGYSGLTRTG